MRFFLSTTVLVLSIMAQGAKADALQSDILSTATYNADYVGGFCPCLYQGWEDGGGNTHYWFSSGPPTSWDWNNVYMEAGLPFITGNVLSATLVLNVIDYDDDPARGGSAILGAQADPANLSGDAYGDATGGSLQANESFVQYVESPAIGPNSFDVTSLVQNDYASGDLYSAFDLTFTGDRNGSSGLDFDPGTSFLLIVTDQNSSAPEPGTFVMLGLGAALMVASRLRRA